MAENMTVLASTLVARLNALLESEGLPVFLVTGGGVGERENRALAQALDSCHERRLAAEQRAEDYSMVTGALVRRLGGRVTVHADELELPPAELVVHHRVGGGGVDIEMRGL